MTDTRSPSQGTDPSDPWDPFERELRALLRDRAAGPAPGSLREAVAATLDAPSGARSRRASVMPTLRALGSIAAS